MLVQKSFNTFLPAFLVFGSTSKHFHHTNYSLGPVGLVPPRLVVSNLFHLATPFENMM